MNKIIILIIGIFVMAGLVYALATLTTAGGGLVGHWVLDAESYDSNTLFVDSNTNRTGIGTTSPTHKLNVAGTFNATSGGSSLIVDANGNVRIGI